MPQLHSTIATVQSERHQYSDAQSPYRRALTIEEAALGPNHPQVFRILKNLARVYYLEGKYQDAEPLYGRALTIGEHSLNPSHPAVVSTLADYAMLLRKLHRNGEARRLEARVRALCAKSDSDNPARFEVDWTDLRRPAK